MRKHTRKLVVAIGVVAIAIGAWAPAAIAGGGEGAGAEPVEGVTDSEIVVSVIAGFTGPFGALNERRSRACRRGPTTSTPKAGSSTAR